MVDLKLDYELNHIYRLYFAVEGPSTGEVTKNTTETLELFEKSLALASDLKRLPVIRGIKGTCRFEEGIFEKMIPAGVQTIELVINLYNGDVDEDNMVDTWIGYIYFSRGHASLVDGLIIHLPEIVWDYEGGILARNILTITASVATDDPCADASLANVLFKPTIYLEIDWTEVTTKELDQFIREFLYARGD